MVQNLADIREFRSNIGDNMYNYFSGQLLTLIKVSFLPSIFRIRENYRSICLFISYLLFVKIENIKGGPMCTFSVEGCSKFN